MTPPVDPAAILSAQQWVDWAERHEQSLVPVGVVRDLLAEILRLQQEAWSEFQRAEHLENKLFAAELTSEGRRLRFEQAEADLLQMQQERDTLKDTNQRLNRRCQLAEAALNTKVEQFEQRSKKALRAYYFAMGKEAGEAECQRLRGAMAAQDEREQRAGEACGVPRDLHGCDWPDAVAEACQRLRAERNRLLQEFVGWLSADIPELHQVEVPLLADSLKRFLAKVESPDA